MRRTLILAAALALVSCSTLAGPSEPPVAQNDSKYYCVTWHNDGPMTTWACTDSVVWHP